jgi:hypothetical protein
MSPPQFGHSSGNSSPTRAMSFAQAIRDVSCEGLAPAAQQSVPVPLAFCPERVRHVFLRENEPDPEGSQIGGRDRAGRQERRRGVTPGVVCSRHEDTVGHAGVEVDMMVERRAEAVQEGDAAEPGSAGTDRRRGPCRRKPRRTPGRSPCTVRGRIRGRGCRTRDSRGVPPRRIPARAARRLPARRASFRGSPTQLCGAGSSQDGAARSNERDDEPKAYRRIAQRQVLQLATACRM